MALVRKGQKDWYMTQSFPELPVCVPGGDGSGNIKAAFVQEKLENSGPSALKSRAKQNQKIKSWGLVKKEQDKERWHEET